MVLLENMYYEDAMDMIELEQYPGNVALSSTKKNPLSVNIANESGTYYMASSDLEQYMEASHEIDAVKALNSIAAANKITTENMVIVVDEACEFVIDTLDEAGIVLEKAAEADSMGLKQAMKWYSKVVSKSKTIGSNATKDMIKERIDVLNDCIKSMEKAKKEAKNGKLGGRVKYALKSIIPFNALFRLVKKQDTYAGVGVLKTGLNTVLNIISFNTGRKIVKSMEDILNTGNPAGAVNAYASASKAAPVIGALSTASSAATLGDIGIRLATYEKMLDAQIERTKEAVAFLQDKLKEMK